MNSLRKTNRKLIRISLFPPVIMLAILPLNISPAFKFILMPGAFLFAMFPKFQSIGALVAIFVFSWLIWYLFFILGFLSFGKTRSPDRNERIHGYLILSSLSIIIISSFAYWLYPRYYFKNTSKIIFEYNNQHGKKADFAVNDAREVQDLINSIYLIKKEPCKCFHFWKVKFQNGGGGIEISICDHCFDIGDGKSIEYYKMPKSFYALFLKQARENKIPEE